MSTGGRFQSIPRLDAEHESSYSCHVPFLPSLCHLLDRSRPLAFHVQPNFEVMRVRIALLTACVVHAATAQSQTTSLSRTEAIQSALERGARLGVARADTAVAGAQVAVARALPNPSFAWTYSRAVPRYHFIADVPIDFPMLRQLRIRAAGRTDPHDGAGDQYGDQAVGDYPLW